MLRKSLLALVTVVAVTCVLVQAQAPKPLSPPGTAATQIGGEWVKGQDGMTYKGGKWIEVTYGRPIKRGRASLFGSGADYGKAVNAGAPVWRAGANQTTRLRTEVPLVFDGKTLPVGEYSVFVDLKEGNWTLIFSNWLAQQKYDPNNKTELWGSYGYTPDKDVLRVPMKLETMPFSMDQFTIAFIDMGADGGRLAMMWDKTMATASFKVGS